MLIGVDVLCRISYSVVSYLYVHFSVLISLVGEARAIFLSSFTCFYVVSVWIFYFLLLVLRIGCVIFLKHSLSLGILGISGLPYYF